MLAARFITGIVLLALFCGALFLLPNGYWSAALLGLLCVAALEWAKLAGYGVGARGAFVAIVFAIAVALLLQEQLVESGAGMLDVFFFWSAALFWIAAAGYLSGAGFALFARLS